MSFFQILFIFTLIALNAFFVGVEFAAVTSRLTRLDLIADPRSRSARIVHDWLENDASRDRLIAASQLGVTLVSLALGAVGENAFQAWLEPYFKNMQMPPALSFLAVILPALPLIISLAVVTSLHVVLGEQVPKVAVLYGPEQFAIRAAPYMKGFSIVFGGFISLLDWAARSVLKLFGFNPNGLSHSAVSSVEELRQIVSGPDVEKMIAPPEREMLSAVIDFNDLVARQVAIPRTEIVAIEADEPLNEAIQLAAKEGITKLPVYENNLDHIIGILHVKDLLQRWQDGSLETGKARDLARDAIFVPESTPVSKLLVQFRTRREHIAIVLDEFGGTLGLVTLEDLMEEIVGDVQDQFDLEPPEVQQQADGTALIDGRMLIEEVNETFDLHLTDTDYDTIAGYILGRLGKIASVGDCVEDTENKVQLKVAEMERLRIARVALTHIEK